MPAIVLALVVTAFLGLAFASTRMIGVLAVVLLFLVQPVISTVLSVLVGGAWLFFQFFHKRS